MVFALPEEKVTGRNGIAEDASQQGGFARPPPLTHVCVGNLFISPFTAQPKKKALMLVRSLQ